MKLSIIATFLTAALHLLDYCNGQAMISNGTYVEDWEADCSTVIAENDFSGTCCSFSDIEDDDSGNLCRLTIAGQDAYCSWINLQYMEECMAAGGCVSGPHISITYFEGTIEEECPPSQYELPTDNSTTTSGSDTDGPSGNATGPDVSFDYDVTLEAIDSCPQGIMNVRVLDVRGNPVANTDVSFLLTGTSGDEYSGAFVTDENGEATYEFSVREEDEGEALWCSLAVENPLAWMGNQQVPCSITVCSGETTSTTDADVDSDPSSPETTQESTSRATSPFKTTAVAFYVALTSGFLLFAPSKY